MNKQRMSDAVEHISKYLTEKQVTYKESYYILETIKSKIDSDMILYLETEETKHI